MAVQRVLQEVTTRKHTLAFAKETLLAGSIVIIVFSFTLAMCGRLNEKKMIGIECVLKICSCNFIYLYTVGKDSVSRG